MREVEAGREGFGERRIRVEVMGRLDIWDCNNCFVCLYLTQLIPIAFVLLAWEIYALENVCVLH